MKNGDIMVSIRCIAYNQGQYIRDTLEGFVMQVANFNFEVIVHDDASTDNTANIIREYAEKYPKIIKPILETENQYSKHDGSLNRIMTSATRGKYVALCEGDDYWIDPFKLQKQVDFLESHPEYSMCCTNAVIQSPQGELEWTRFEEDCDISIDKMVRGGGSLIMTCTEMYKKEVLELYGSLDFCMKCMIGDYCMQILSSLEGKVRYMHEKTAVYRYQSVGSWTMKSETEKVVEQVSGWKSQIVMLKGFDNFSKGKYHLTFYETQVALVDWLCRTHINDWERIVDGMKDIVRLPLTCRFNYFCKKNEYVRLYWLCDLVAIIRYKSVKLLKLVKLYSLFIKNK